MPKCALYYNVINVPDSFPLVFSTSTVVLLERMKVFYDFISIPRNAFVLLSYHYDTINLFVSNKKLLFHSITFNFVPEKVAL